MRGCCRGGFAGVPEAGDLEPLCPGTFSVHMTHCVPFCPCEIPEQTTCKGQIWNLSAKSSFKREYLDWSNTVPGALPQRIPEHGLSCTFVFRCVSNENAST